MKRWPEHFDPMYFHVGVEDLHALTGHRFTRKHLRHLIDTNQFPAPLLIGGGKGGGRIWIWPLQVILDYVASRPVRVPEPQKASVRKAARRAEKREAKPITPPVPPQPTPQPQPTPIVSKRPRARFKPKV